MKARFLTAVSLAALMTVAPARAADPHDIIGGLIGLGILAEVLDDSTPEVHVEHRYNDDSYYSPPRYYYEPPRYHDDRDRRRHHQRHHLSAREARERCEHALYREKPKYVLHDIDRFDYDRRRGSYHMLLEASKHGNHRKWRRYWCEVDAHSGRVDLDKAG